MHVRSLVITMVVAATARGEVFSYECTSFPEDAGWEVLTQFCDPETWLDNGWYLQHVQPGCGGPPGGAQDGYTQTLGDFAGEEQFFVEWRVQTDGDSSEIDGVAPASLVAAGFAGILYHFTIADDRVRFLRDADFPIVWVDIEPGVPHTYRLELYGEDFYVWFIDGQVADSGKPEGAYPDLFSSINWLARSWFLESTTQWDYIRYGTIPEPASGDFDSDDDVDLDDYYFFQDCVTGPDTDAGPGCVWADFDGDSDVDLIDFGHFQAAFTGSDG